MRITAVTCVKNEGPFLLEWIAFNRVIGVTDFIFYSNDCSDHTDDLLDALAARSFVQHLPNPAEGRNYQMEALKHAAILPSVTGSDWVWIADVDEFLNIHVGDGTIPELIEACGDPQAISVTFQFMANNDVENFEDRPVIEQFTWTHNPDIWCDEIAQEVKTLVRRDFPLRYYGAHRPFAKGGLPKDQKIAWTDGSGRDIPRDFRLGKEKNRRRKFPAKGARRFATVNHYALRSLDSYLVKNDRGDVNREHRQFDDHYWRDRNDPSWEDRSILRYLPRLKAEIALLMEDEEIARLHHAAVAAHIAKRDELLEQESYRTLRQRIRDLPQFSAAEAALMEIIS